MTAGGEMGNSWRQPRLIAFLFLAAVSFTAADESVTWTGPFVENAQVTLGNSVTLELKATGSLQNQAIEISHLSDGKSNSCFGTMYRKASDSTTFDPLGFAGEDDPELRRFTADWEGDVFTFRIDEVQAKDVGIIRVDISDAGSKGIASRKNYILYLEGSSAPPAVSPEIKDPDQPQVTPSGTCLSNVIIFVLIAIIVTALIMAGGVWCCFRRNGYKLTISCGPRHPDAPPQRIKCQFDTEACEQGQEKGKTVESNAMAPTECTDDVNEPMLGGNDRAGRVFQRDVTPDTVVRMGDISEEDDDEHDESTDETRMTRVTATPAPVAQPSAAAISNLKTIVLRTHGADTTERRGSRTSSETERLQELDFPHPQYTSAMDLTQGMLDVISATRIHQASVARVKQLLNTKVTGLEDGFKQYRREINTRDVQNFVNDFFDTHALDPAVKDDVNRCLGEDDRPLQLLMIPDVVGDPSSRLVCKYLLMSAVKNDQCTRFTGVEYVTDHVLSTSCQLNNVTEDELKEFVTYRAQEAFKQKGLVADIRLY